MKIRKAILTGGGRATRLRPITSTLNKHLIPLANKPMIFYAIEKAVEAGIEEIFINVNPEENQLQEHVGDGGHWGIKIKFFVQEGGPQGIAHVVKCAQKFIREDPFMFYLSDNIILGSLKPILTKFEAEEYDCMLTISKVPDPERFGVPIFDEKGALIDTVEKPERPPNNFAVTGIYLYGSKIFFKAFEHIQKSARGEYEISSIHSYLLKNKSRIGWQEITGWWKDTGKPDDLLLANQLLLDELPVAEYKIAGSIEPGAKLEGKVAVGAGTVVKNNARIRGPAIIGANCLLENCYVAPYTTIGSGTTVNGAEIGQSIILGNCRLEGPLKINHSLLSNRVVVRKEGKGGEEHLIVGENTILEF